MPFKVAQVNDAWSIPSHENYPADAEDQLGEAAAGMIGLKVVDMASDDPDTHPLYGVVDPESKSGSTAAEDVGTAPLAVRLTSAPVLTVTVDYAVVGGTATGGGADGPATAFFPPRKMVRKL